MDNNIYTFPIRDCSFNTAYEKLLEGFEIMSKQTKKRYKMITMPITGYKKLHCFECGKWRYIGYIQTQEIFNPWIISGDSDNVKFDFKDLNIDIENDTQALLKIKHSNKPWVLYQISKEGMYYSFDNRLERIYFIDKNKLSEYDIKIVK